MPYIGTSPSQGVRRVHTYTATANQTSFSGAGAEGATLSYKDSNFVDVYQNGVKLGDADYTATSGTAIVLGTGATVSDLVVIVAYDVFSAADTVSKADGGQFDGNVTMAGTLGVTGVLTGTSLDISGNIDIDGTTNLDVVDIDGAVDMATTLTLAGNADFNGDLDVDGTTNLDAVDIDGAVDINAQTNIHSNLVLDDSNKVILGNGSDLQLYHDGSNSYVDEQGTGNLIIRGTQIQLKASDGTSYAEFTDGGASVLRHSGDLKLTTESGGIAVTGAISASSGDITITDGNLVVANGHGIDFGHHVNASGISSELLNDYEEGTWIPTITAYTGTNPTITFASGYSASGYYTKIGRLVNVNFNIPNFTVSGTTSGIMLIGGLPFATGNAGISNGDSLSAYKVTFARGSDSSITLRTFGTTTMGILTSDNGGTWNWEIVSIFGTGANRYLHGSITYKAN